MSYFSLTLDQHDQPTDPHAASVAKTRERPIDDKRIKLSSWIEYIVLPADINMFMEADFNLLIVENNREVVL